MKIVKKLGSALIVILVLAAIILVSYFAVSRLVTEVTGLIRDFPDLYEQTETGLEKIGQTLSGVFVRLPEGIQNGWTSLVENLDDYMGNLMSKVSEPTVTAAGNAAKKVPYMLVSFIVMIMSAYFFIVQREDVIHWMKGIAPEAVTKRMAMVMDNLKYAVGGYFKAQFKIMGIVFLILLAGLGFLKIHYFVLIAFLIAFLDFLPFFGTGTAMIPWAVYEVFMGEYKVAAALLIIYVVTQAVRQLIQPKLVGDSVGLNPLVTLLLIYIGYRIGGVIWMILAVPVGMVLINMCQAGAFDYIFDDVKILTRGILGLRQEQQTEKEHRPNTRMAAESVGSRRHEILFPPAFFGALALPVRAPAGDEGEVYEQREKAERQYTGDDAYRCGQGIGLRKAGQNGVEKRETDQTGADGVERLHAVVVV